MSSNEKNTPAHTIRISKVKATIWLNDTEKGPRYNTTFTKLYRLKLEDRASSDDGWRESASFSRDDLLLLAKVSDLAHSWIHEQAA